VPSEDGHLLASASKDKVSFHLSFRNPPFSSDPQTAKLWDPRTGECKGELRGHDNELEAVCFAPVAAYAAIRELAGLPVSADYQQRWSHISNHTIQMTGSKDPGAYVATGSRDKNIKLWDVHSGQMIKNLVCISLLSAHAY